MRRILVLTLLSTFLTVGISQTLVKLLDMYPVTTVLLWLVLMLLFLEHGLVPLNLENQVIILFLTFQKGSYDVMASYIGYARKKFQMFKLSLD